MAKFGLIPGAIAPPGWDPSIGVSGGASKPTRGQHGFSGVGTEGVFFFVFFFFFFFFLIYLFILLYIYIYCFLPWGGDKDSPRHPRNSTQPYGTLWKLGLSTTGILVPALPLGFHKSWWVPFGFLLNPKGTPCQPTKKKSRATNVSSWSMLYEPAQEKEFSCQIT